VNDADYSGGCVGGRRLKEISLEDELFGRRWPLHRDTNTLRFPLARGGSHSDFDRSHKLEKTGRIDRFDRGSNYLPRGWRIDALHAELGAAKSRIALYRISLPIAEPDSFSRWRRRFPLVGDSSRSVGTVSDCREAYVERSLVDEQSRGRYQSGSAKLLVVPVDPSDR